MPAARRDPARLGGANRAVGDAGGVALLSFRLWRPGLK